MDYKKMGTLHDIQIEKAVEALTGQPAAKP